MTACSEICLLTIVAVATVFAAIFAAIATAIQWVRFRAARPVLEIKWLRHVDLFSKGQVVIKSADHRAYDPVSIEILSPPDIPIGWDSLDTDSRGELTRTPQLSSGEPFRFESRHDGTFVVEISPEILMVMMAEYTLRSTGKTWKRKISIKITATPRINAAVPSMSQT